MPDEIPLFEISWDGGEVRNAVESICRGGYWAKGPYVSEFEDRLEEYLGVEHAITVNSGTTALESALVAHGVGPGDEVIVPSFTFVATANVVELVGATPVFADIERDTYGLDPEAVRDAISPSTAAVLPVHPYGAACKIDRIVEVARERDVTVVEDAAEALGADADGRMVGTFGDSAALSFCQNKVVATGEGGAVVTDDDDVAERLRLYRSHGRVSGDYFGSADSGRYVSAGTNYRMADVVAAIGCAQLDKIERLVGGRRRAADRLTDEIGRIDGIEPHTGDGSGRHVNQLYTVTLDDSLDRDAIIETLASKNVASKVYWDPPVHRTGHYRERHGSAALPVTDDISSRVLSLPMYPELSQSGTDHIAEAVRAAVGRA
ncbi:DegT/DnrJ/EryC1/StrS family aminotransferase [Halorussus caseinilyticus]|uniref:DegT/DnrJ/EryC1/StrS family aminotransferase n=1 Tax=Halorussus caseinilyticus TaxID=3034025 RepID=UPI0023E8F17D|nr:DegT/DnrJ/EryC1/StrS family aminotransferase [Halorussus sp. DT72]